jgi:hypothetical protein
MGKYNAKEPRSGVYQGANYNCDSIDMQKETFETRIAKIYDHRTKENKKKAAAMATA